MRTGSGRKNWGLPPASAFWRKAVFWQRFFALTDLRFTAQHARQGSTRAPQWTGGGVVFAPTPRDYTIRLNKKEKRLALKSALTSRVLENKLIVVDELKFDEVKTKNFANVMNNLKASKALVVLNENDANVVLSARNIPTVKTALTNTINVFDILKYNTVIVTKAALATIEEVYA